MSSRVLLNFLMGTLIEECQPKKMHNNKKRKNLKRLLLTHYVTSFRRRIPKNEKYFDIIETFQSDVFQSHFRMLRSTFNKLLVKLKPHWKKAWTGRPAINLKHSLYITIWKLSSNSTLRELSDRFNVAKGTVYKVIIKVSKVLTSLKKDFITWPTLTEYNKKIEEFENLRSRPFPHVIGCIDGTHVEIPSPTKDSYSYYNRKGKHSLILQAVCDARCVFTDIYFGWPGSSHDAAVWRNSPLCKGLENGTIPIPREAHLLGDSAYPLSNYLMVPYRDNGYLTEKERKFNACLSSTRVIVEQAFGILKNKFSILKRLEMKNLRYAKYVVTSCVILHNFIILFEGFDSLEEPSENERDEEMGNIPEIVTVGRAHSEAKEKRDAIANLINA